MMDDKIRLLRIIRDVLAFTSVSLIILLFSASCFYFIIRLYGNSQKFENEEVDYLYQYYETNPSTNNTNSGFVTLARPIEDSIFYHNEEETSYTLISDFETTQYQCTGSCGCLVGNDEEEDRRRSSSSSSSTFIFTRGLIYLIAALTSVGITQKAEQYFEEECKKKIQAENNNIECPTSSLFVQVEKCEEIHSSSETSSSSSEKKYYYGSEIECFGNCYPVDFLKDDPFMTERSAWFEFESDEVRKDVKQNFVHCQKKFENYLGECSNMNMRSLMGIDKKKGFQTLNEVKIYFIFLSLNNFCWDNSVGVLEFTEKNIQKFPEFPKGRIDSYFCIGVEPNYFHEFRNLHGTRGLVGDAQDDVFYGSYPHEYEEYIMNDWDAKKLNPTVQCVVKKEVLSQND